MSLPSDAILRPEDIDLRDTEVLVSTIVPNLGARIGRVVGDIQRSIDAVTSAASLLQSGDGLKISASMAAAIQAFTGWLQGKIAADSVTERLNISTAQRVFVGPPAARWMWREPVGGPPANKARTKIGIGWPSTRLLAQWRPGAVYVFPRIGFDIIRRSFGRTDLANVFDDGQPSLKWSAADLELADCPTRLADYWGGRGCGYNPGEKIQLSAGTWPYTSGRQVQDWSGLQAVDMVGHYIALHTPSAVHVTTDAREVAKVWARWKSLVVDKLPPRAEVGQMDDGVYRRNDDSIYVQGDVGQTVYINVGGVQWPSTAQAVQYVTASFLGFFNLREAVLRDWEYLSPTVQAEGLKSQDPAIKARASGGAYQGPSSDGPGRPPVGPGSVTSNTGPNASGAVAGAIAGALGLAWLASRGRR